MNRRNFLRLTSLAPIAIVASAELAELLTPKRTIFLPPKGGWQIGKYDVAVKLTPEEIYANMIRFGPSIFKLTNSA